MSLTVLKAFDAIRGGGERRLSVYSVAMVARITLTHCNYDVVDHCLMEFVYHKLNYLVVLRHFVHAFVLDETALRLQLFPFVFLTFVQILQLQKTKKNHPC